MRFFLLLPVEESEPVSLSLLVTCRSDSSGVLGPPDFYNALLIALLDSNEAQALRLYPT